MKNLFILLIMFSLFISGCELVEEREPQLSGIYHEDGDQTMQLDIGSKRGGYNPVTTTFCSNVFFGTCGSPSGDDIYETHCSQSYNLGCAGTCYVSIDSQSCGFYDPSIGNCYCEGDGICHTEYGEPITSEDCSECTPDDTQSCDLPTVPGSCGECNAGLKTCSAQGQWGECEQVINPVQEICGNDQDDDCDCTPDNVDADCFLTHMECINEQCIEVDGSGSDQCSYDTDCIDVVGSANWARVYPTEPFVWGGGGDYTTCEEECDTLGYGDCIASDGAAGECDALVAGGDIVKGTVYNNILTGSLYSYDSCNMSLWYSGVNGRNWCCCSDAPTTETFCGDGVLQSLNGEGMNEACDISDFGGETCSNLGYDGGSLSCETYNCRLDKSGCDDTCRNEDGDGYYFNGVSHLGNQLYEVHHGTTFDGNNRAGSAQFSLPGGYYSFECNAIKSKVSMYNGPLLGDGFWGPYPTEDNVLVDLAAECDCDYDYGAFEMPGANVTSDNGYVDHDCAGQTMNREIIIYLPAGEYSIYVSPPSGVFAPSDMGSYGRLSESFVTCTGQIDCDDDSVGVQPGIIENLINNVDDNCDGLIDVL